MARARSLESRLARHAGAVMVAAALFGSASAALAQAPASPAGVRTQPGDVKEMAFPDGGRPGVLRAEVAGGRLVVRAAEGRTVRVHDAAGVRLQAERGDNVVVLTVAEPRGAGASPSDIVVEVPADTAVRLTATGQASLAVERVRGETRVTAETGSIALEGVTGRVVAETRGGAITARLDRPPSEPLSFTTLTGPITVRLPAETRADVRLDRVEGGFTSDFYMDMLPPEERQIVDDRRPEGGRFHIKIEKTLRGRIDGGGPEIAIRTVSGDIRIEQAR
jgi:hypothetical protein